MRILVLVSLLLLLGCSTGSSGTGFLGYPDDRTRTIQDEHPEVDRSIYGTVTMTPVKDVTYDQYLRAKQADRIKHEENRGAFVYFATEREVPTPAAPEGPNSYAAPFYKVTERYRAPLQGQ